MLDVTKAAELVIPCGVLADALKRTRFAISTEKTRYYLNGVFLHREKDKIKLASTDGHRLSVVTLEPESPPIDFPPAIIPRAAVADMLKSGIGKSKAAHRNVVLSVASGRVLLSDDAGTALVDCAPIDGTFPDYNRVIPQGNEIHATVNRLAFANIAAGMAAFMAKATRNNHGAKLDFNDDTLHITCTPLVDAGRGVDNVPAALSAKLKLSAPVKKPIQIGFNAAYLSEIADSFEGPQITIDMADPGSPTVIRGTEGMDSHHLTCVMPMRI